MWLSLILFVMLCVAVWHVSVLQDRWTTLCHNMGRSSRTPAEDILEEAARLAKQPDGLEAAWGLIANAYRGDWDLAPSEWHSAAERWRDEHWHGPQEREKMQPVKFTGHNLVLAGNQPEYLDLPAVLTDDQYISCWQLTWKERLILLLTGRLWLRQLHCGRGLQPQKPQVEEPKRLDWWDDKWTADTWAGVLHAIIDHGREKRADV